VDPAGSALSCPRGHRLRLEGRARFADLVGGHDVPFTERVHLGGGGPMSGLHEGRLAFAVSIHTVGVGVQSLSLLFGGGTETFAQGGHLGEVRLAFGLKQGF
jgi:hypothetical protein